jgi:hypothetical protein
VPPQKRQLSGAASGPNNRKQDHMGCVDHGRAAQRRKQIAFSGRIILRQLFNVLAAATL